MPLGGAFQTQESSTLQQQTSFSNSPQPRDDVRAHHHRCDVLLTQSARSSSLVKAAGPMHIFSQNYYYFLSGSQLNLMPLCCAFHMQEAALYNSKQASTTHLSRGMTSAPTTTVVMYCSHRAHSSSLNTAAGPMHMQRTPDMPRGAAPGCCSSSVTNAATPPPRE
jgi:hypothetical protein